MPDKIRFLSETREKRKGGGISETGTVPIACYTKNSKLHLVIKDDGQGVDGDRLAPKAVENFSSSAGAKRPIPAKNKNPGHQKQG